MLNKTHKTQASTGVLTHVLCVQGVEERNKDTSEQQHVICHIAEVSSLFPLESFQQEKR